MHHGLDRKYHDKCLSEDVEQRHISYQNSSFISSPIVNQESSDGIPISTLMSRIRACEGTFPVVSFLIDHDLGVIQGSISST